MHQGCQLLLYTVCYLQGPAGEREEEEGGHRKGEGADGAGEAGSDDEALSVRGEDQEGRERFVCVCAHPSLTMLSICMGK